MSEYGTRSPDQKAVDFLNSFFHYLVNNEQKVRRVVTSRSFMLEALKGKRIIEVSLNEGKVYLNEDGALEKSKPEDVLPEEIFQFSATELT